ncbi:MAG TPA: phosphatase PAP2 family protein [Clostridia bacterium]|nr:phosphatase PAP2 family protein [Clostridia bacterium]
MAAVILAFGIAFSRIFLFVHYPSDTLIGSLLGISCAFLIIFLYHV